MASTIDQISSLASPTWREAATRAARQRVVQIPDRALRNRQIGWTVLDQGLPERTRPTGLAAYVRQAEQYSRWKEAAAAAPIRQLPMPRSSSTGVGAYLDVKV